MRAANLFAIFVTAIWTAWLWSGMYLIQGIIAQKEPGYPEANQVNFLIGIPLEALTIMLISIALVAILNRFFIALVVISGIALAGVVPYLLFYGAGV
jgi:hypothetical protein